MYLDQEHKKSMAYIVKRNKGKLRFNRETFCVSEFIREKN